MKRVYKLVLILVSFYAISAKAQQKGTLKGTVTDAKTKETLVGVNVLLEDSTGTATDITGQYELKTRSGKQNIVFRFVGYKPQVVSVNVPENETKQLDVMMDDTQKQLPIFVISAGKFEQKISDVTVSMEVLTPSMVENTNTVSMETAIDQAPGVNMTDGQANIRGGGGWSYGAGSRVLVMVDDLPMLTADAGDVKWSFLPVENLEQIEIIKGASSSLFGSSALNGVINIRTAYPKLKPETRINVFTGMYDNPINPQMKWWKRSQPIYEGTNFFHSQQFKQFDLVVGGNYYSDDGYREGEVEQRERINCNTRYRFKNIEGLSVGVNINMMHTVGGNFLLWENDSTGALRPRGGIDTTGTTLSNYTTRRTNIDPFITYFDKKGHRHKIRMRWFNTTNINDTQQGSIGNVYYGEYQYQQEIKKYKINFTTGITAIKTTTASDLYKGDSLSGTHSGFNGAWYGQFDKKFNRVAINLGFRAETNSLDGDKAVSRFEFDMKDGKKVSVPLFVRTGINYQVLEATYLRASYGQGYRYPTVAEKFVKTSVGGLNIFPSDSLQPETGWSAEFAVKQGFKVSSWLGYIDVAGFYTHYRDMMEYTFGLWEPKLGFGGIGFKSLNVGNATIRGVEVSIIGQGKLFGLTTNVLAGYTYMDPYDENTDSTYLAHKSTPDHFLKYRYQHIAKLDLETGYKKFSLGLDIRYNSFMKNIDATFESTLDQAFVAIGEYRKTHHTGDYTIDARIAMKMNETSKVAFIVKNVLNREVMGRPADMQPPRSFVIQYTMSF